MGGCLFKPEHLHSVADGLARGILARAEAGPYAILAIWNAVRFGFYDVDITTCVNDVKRSLDSPTLLQALATRYTPTTNPPHETESEQISGAFFRYFFTRLPLLLYTVQVREHGRRRRASAKEAQAIARVCLNQWVEAHPTAAEDVLSRPEEYARFKGLSRWYVSSRRLDDAAYQIDWLWETLEAEWPTLMDRGNVSAFTTHVLEECFPMFWNGFVNHYGRTLVFAGNFGRLAGTLSTEELAERVLKEEARRSE